MSQWYRVFALAAAAPEPAELVAQLQQHFPDARGDFRGDDQGWFAATLQLPAGKIAVERYLAEEEGLRAELNAWAAWVEQTGHSASTALMQHLISTRQIFTFTAETEAHPGLAAGQRQLALWLAGICEAVIQIDGEGFLTATGELLVPEA